MAYSWQFDVDAKHIARRMEICRIYETKQFCRVELENELCLEVILEKCGKGNDRFRVVKYYPGFVQSTNGDWYIAGQEGGEVSGDWVQSRNRELQVAEQAEGSGSKSKEAGMADKCAVRSDAMEEEKL
jgi:hypothetical protein